jgi:hypothetical protein
MRKRDAWVLAPLHPFFASSYARGMEHSNDDFTKTVPIWKRAKVIKPLYSSIILLAQS